MLIRYQRVETVATTPQLVFAVIYPRTRPPLQIAANQRRRFTSRLPRPASVERKRPSHAVERP